MKKVFIFLLILAFPFYAFSQHKEVSGGVRVYSIKGTDLSTGQFQAPTINDIDATALIGNISLAYYLPFKKMTNSSIGLTAGGGLGTSFGGSNVDFSAVAFVPVDLNYRFGFGSFKGNDSKFGFNLGLGAELNATAFGIIFENTDSYTNVFVLPKISLGFVYSTPGGKIMMVKYSNSLSSFEDPRTNEELDLSYGPKISYGALSLVFIKMR